MTLYEIDQRITSLVDPETGELMDFDAFQQLQMDRQEKIEGAVLWYKDLTSEAKAIKEEEQKLAERRKAAERRADGLLRWITISLNGEKFSTPRCSVSYRTSRALEVEDAVLAAEWLNENGHLDMVVYSEPKLDKRAIKELLKQGDTIPGTAMVDRKSTQVR